MCTSQGPLYILCGFDLWDHSGPLTSHRLDVTYKSGSFLYSHLHPRMMCVPKEKITEIQACPTQHTFTFQGLVQKRLNFLALSCNGFVSCLYLDGHLRNFTQQRISTCLVGTGTLFGDRKGNSKSNERDSFCQSQLFFFCMESSKEDTSATLHLDLHC